MKNILLIAINAKYIHSNLAVYSLKAYAEKEKKDVDQQILIKEYTINQQQDEILQDLYKKQPDMVCFSTYIWNVSYVRALIREIPKILPGVSIWLGGPEVSYDSRQVLEQFPMVTGVMKGEGEETFSELLSQKPLETVAGITYRDEAGEIKENPWREVMDLNKVPFIYEDMGLFENKIIYYESSRGCPFSCSYCLSSVDKKLRFRDLELVKKELQFFIDQEVPQVKFVDRTFNCKHDHAMGIWKYIMDHDKGITNFHFEVSADLLNEEEIALIRSMRPGLIQLEIGVQSTNETTVREIKRTMQFPKLAKAVKAIGEIGNVHQHLDLIAGLPYEDLESFQTSFCQVYALKPQQLQLGFLKVLKGSYMETQKQAYELQYKERPPYEVLSTAWLPYQDIVLLKGVEEMVEVYYNSAQYTETLKELEKEFADPFTMYKELASFYEEEHLFEGSHRRAARYEILLRFITKHCPEKGPRFRELLTLDYYLRENAKTRPDFAGEYVVEKEELRNFYEKEAKVHQYLDGYESYDKNQMRKMTHYERFETLQKTILFDYKNKNDFTKEAKTIVIAKLD